MTAIVDFIRMPGRSGFSGWRMGVLGLFMFGVGALMIARLVSLQVLEPERFVEHGENQRIRTAALSAERGSIVDRNGIELAVSTPRERIWADPRLVTQPIRTARQIVAIAGGDEDQLTRRLQNEDAKFAWLARQLDDEQAEAILSLDLPGVYSTEEQSRITPAGSEVARGILGRTDVDGIGLSGLEAQYNESLTGEEGRIVVERGIASAGSQAVTIPDGEYELVSPTAGDSLVLTIDRSVQFEVENLLAETVAESGAVSGTAIVSRTATGEILAMSTVARNSDDQVVVSGENRAVTWIVEPGSISKPLAIAALIEEDLIDSDTSVEVVGSLRIFDQTFTDTVFTGLDELNTADILRHSSNIGTALLVDRIGDETFHEYLSDFGLGSPTELDFPGESAGILHPEEEWSGVSRPAAAIGYGYAATPLQMLRSYNVFANDGVLVEPHLVAGFQDADGDLDIVSPREGRRVISEETAREVTSLLTGVVTEGGTGQLASVPGYQIAGKTGTAQIAQPGGGYTDEFGEVDLLTSFAGFFPASNPEYSIIAIIEEPQGEVSGGQIAAPLFADITSFVLQHFRVPPAETAFNIDLASNGE